MDLVIRISVVHIILGRGSMGMCSMAEGIEGEAWCEIGLVAQELDRSLYTVDGWVRKGRAGVKLRSRREGSRRYGRTLDGYGQGDGPGGTEGRGEECQGRVGG